MSSTPALGVTYHVCTRSFSATEKDIFKDFKQNPNDMSPIFKELQQVQGEENPAQFQKDLAKLNKDLQDAGLLPKLDLINADPTAADGFSIVPNPSTPADLHLLRVRGILHLRALNNLG